MVIIIKRTNKKSIREQKNIYTCRYCNNEKSEDKFFKCAIQNKSFICTDCIKKIYNRLNENCEKYLAIFICCHYLDIAFDVNIYNSLEIGQGIGHYVKQLNLVQNMQNQSPDTFADGIIKSNIINYVPKDEKNEKDKIKQQLKNIIAELEMVTNDV